MIRGNHSVLGRCLFLLTLVGTMVLASLGWAQTPGAACAADSLYLISPSAVHLVQQAVGRPGLTISWEDLDTGEATCFTVRDTAGLGFTVGVEGGFGDSVDRVFLFSTEDAGSIGQQTDGNMQFTWISQGNSINGVLSGNLNLANNGGILSYPTGAGQWDQINSGLPMTWRFTNVVALAEGAGGFLVAAFTAGQSLDSDVRGLFVNSGSGWNRVAEDIFTEQVLVTCIAVSGTDNNHFAVGTSRDGLFVTSDGGQTFTQFQDELDPGASAPPSNWSLSALNWDSSRLFAFVPNYDLFISSDNGANFNRAHLVVEDNLDNVVPAMIPPNKVQEIVVNPSDPDHVLVALRFNGVFQSFDGGSTWNNMYGDLLVPVPGNDGAWSYTAYSCAVDPNDSQIVVAGMVQKGLFRTTDGGVTWTEVGAAVQPEALSELSKLYLRVDPGTPGLIYCLEDNHKLLVSTDSGAIWNEFADQPFIVQGLSLYVSRDGSGDLIIGSWGGGIYEPGSDVVLSDTYNTATTDELRTLDLGLYINFDGDLVNSFDSFTLVCQTFQGWAVWRAPDFDRDNMVLLGLYDRVNQESCIEGYCGDESYELVPQCYVSKRAACFKFSPDCLDETCPPDSVYFFDDEVYNGFSYYYAVSSFDYGNTALDSPQNNAKSMIFSPRWAGDELSPFLGDGNRSPIQINEGAAAAAGGEEIYVYPNPLRRDTGIPGQEGHRVTFTNLPPDSRIRIFTTAGDDVFELGPEFQIDGNMHWETMNREGELTASGVYLYLVEMPQREDYWGKLVIIR